MRGFVTAFREDTERFQGVSPEEFWEIAEDVTGEAPSGDAV